MRRARTVFIAVLVVLLVSALMVGCSKTNSNASQNSSQKDNANPTATKDNSKNNSEDVKEEIKEFKVWINLHPDAAENVNNHSESNWYKKAEEATGIHIEYIHPSVGQEKEQFNLLISTGDFPDAIEDRGYPGGAEKAIEDGVYIPLNDIIASSAPNYSKVIAMDPEISRQLKTTDGTIWSFSKLQPDPAASWSGIIFRKDLLDKAGLDIPYTIDDWDIALRAFKDLGVQIPLLIQFNWRLGADGAFISAYDVSTSYVKKDDKIVFSPIDDNYRLFLEQMHTWYKDGILDTDFATRDGKSKTAEITNGNIAVFHETWNKIEGFETSAREVNPDFDLIAVRNPSLTAGETAQYRQKNNYVRGNNVAITTACEAPEILASYFDYFYRGTWYEVFGEEDVTYEIKDGTPKPIVHTPEEKKDLGLLTGILNPWEQFPCWLELLTDEDVMYKDGIEARKEWMNNGTDLIVPPIKQTAEETEKISALMTEIKTYVSEMTLKFIVGDEPLDKFDEYVEQIEKMGIEEVIGYKQVAYERYMKN